MEAKIIRVFPTKTNATPDDELVRIREVPSLFDEADEVHISVAFTWDIPWAEWARPAMGTNCSGEDRRSCLQRARRGVRSGNVHEEGLRHHLARMPEPLLVLRRTQTRRRSAPGVTRARRMDRPRRQSACLLARTHRRGVRHACPATASAAVRRRTGGRAYDPGDGRTATRVTPRFALFRIRYTQRPRTAQSRRERCSSMQA